MEWRMEYSSRWTVELINTYNIKKGSKDGAFFMSFDDFLKYYASLGIAKINPNYVTTSKRIDKRKKWKLLKY